MNTEDALKSGGIREDAKAMLHKSIQLPLQGVMGLSNLTDRFYLYTLEVQAEGHRLHKLEMENITAKAEADQEFLPQLREIAKLNRQAELAEQLATAKARLATAGTTTTVATTSTASKGSSIDPMADASAV